MGIERRKSRQIDLGGVAIGGDAPVSIQSMTTTKTADIDATLQQIASLVAAGVDIVRVAVPHWEDAEALVAIAAKSPPASSSARMAFASSSARAKSSSVGSSPGSASSGRALTSISDSWIRSGRFWRSSISAVTSSSLTDTSRPSA